MAGIDLEERHHEIRPGATTNDFRRAPERCTFSLSPVSDSLNAPGVTEMQRAVFLWISSFWEDVDLPSLPAEGAAGAIYVPLLKHNFTQTRLAHFYLLAVVLCLLLFSAMLGEKNGLPFSVYFELHVQTLSGEESYLEIYITGEPSALSPHHSAVMLSPSAST